MHWNIVVAIVVTSVVTASAQQFVCKEGWSKLDGPFSNPFCVYVSEVGASVQEARDFCSSHISYLLDPHDTESFNLFVNLEERQYNLGEYLYKFHGISQFWSSMGVRDSRLVVEKYGRSYVTRGRFTTFSSWNWEEGHPSLVNGTCGQIRLGLTEQEGFDPETKTQVLVTVFGGQYWVSLQDCATAQRFVCVSPEIRLEAKIASFCPTGWVGNIRVPECYRIFDDPKNFTDANESCLAMGGRLAPSITLFDSQFVTTVLKFYTTSSSVPSYFAGIWTDSSPPVNGICTVFWGELDEPITSQLPCNRTRTYMCSIPTVATDPDYFEIYSPYQSEAELLQYQPFQLALPVSCKSSRPRTEAELGYIHTPPRILNLTGQNDFRFPLQQSSFTDVPFYSNISIPAVETPQRKRRSRDMASDVVETPQRKRRSRDMASDAVETPQRKGRSRDMASDVVETPQRKRRSQDMASDAVETPQRKRRSQDMASDAVETPQRKRRSLDMASDKAASFVRKSLKRIKRQGGAISGGTAAIEGSGSDLPLLAPGFIANEDLNNVGSAVEYVGYYSCELYSINPPRERLTESVLVRYAESDLFIYVAQVRIDTDKLGSFEVGLRPEDMVAFNLIGDFSYISDINEFTGDLRNYRPGFEDEGIGPNDAISLQFYRAVIEKVRVEDLTVKFRIFLVPATVRQKVAVNEQHMLQAMKTYWKDNTGNIFFPSSLQIRSTVTCSVITATEPDSNVTVKIPATRVGETGYSYERCQTGPGAIAQAECLGGFDNGVFWGEVVFRNSCSPVEVDELPKSTSTANLRNLSLTDIDLRNLEDVITNTTYLTVPEIPLTEADIIYVAEILENYKDFDVVIPQVLEEVTDIMNNMLEANPTSVSTAQTIAGGGNRIIKSFDDLSNQLILTGVKAFKVVQPLIATLVFDRDAANDSLVIGLELEGRRVVEIEESSLKPVTMPSDVVLEESDAAIYLPGSVVAGGSSRLSLQIYAETHIFATSGNRFKINSKVVAARLTKDNVPIEDLGEARVTALFLPVEASDDIVCAYWDYDANEDAGGWSTDGCTKTMSGDHIICECDHLTNFAILIDLQAHEIPEAHQQVLGVITTVGLVISIVALGITLVTFLLFKQLRHGRGQQVLVNLSLAMLCSSIVFLVGAERTDNKNGCIAVAALLHYFILVSFMWMLIEGLLQYLRFVKVLGTYIPRFLIKTAIPAWGLPIVPIIVLVAIDTDLYYGGKGYCWMGFTAMLYAFLIPIGVVMLANIIVFILVLKNICCRRKVQVNQSERKMMFLNFQAALSIFVVLGLTWVFGFLAVDGARLVFHYLFTICNAFQGLFIFLLFTAREKKIRQAWRRLCCKRKGEKVSTSGDERRKAANVDSRSTGYTSSGGSGGGHFDDIRKNGDERTAMQFNNHEYDNTAT